MADGRQGSGGQTLWGLIVLGLLGWGLWAGISYLIDQAKSHSTVQASAPDPRDEQIRNLSEKVAALEQQKPEHRYELRIDGLRTFRFDPDSGETCIQLTTKADWKQPDTKRQSCEYEDYMRDKIAGSPEWEWGECIYLNDKSACGLAARSPLPTDSGQGPGLLPPHAPLRRPKRDRS